MDLGGCLSYELLHANKYYVLLNLLHRILAHELEFYVEDLEEYSTNLHEEVHRLNNLLDPNHEPQADAMDPGVIIADDDELEEEEEEDLEELVMVDESDNEGGDVSRMDTDHEV